MTNKSKALRNLISGLVSQILIFAFGIILPRIVITSLGSEANGLLNSVNTALVYLSLLEGGLGLSITQSLYGPVANNSITEINSIMSASNLFYKKVGSWYLLGIFGVAVVYTFTVTTTLSKTTVFLVVLLSGLPGAINFFFQGKYRTLMSVDGRGYILTNLSTVVTIGTSITKVVLLLSGFGVVAIQLMFCVSSLLQMAVIIGFVKKNYSWLDLKVEPAYDKIGQRKAVFWHQISGLIFGTTDTLMLTYFCDLKMVSVYTLYNMLFTTISSLILNLTGSVNFYMGQKYNSNRDEYMKLHRYYENIGLLFAFALLSVVYVCSIPFMKLYTTGVTDTNYIDNVIPSLLLSVQLFNIGRAPYTKVIEYAGEFAKTQTHAIIEMVVNIVVSFIGVFTIGVYGVLLGTVVAMAVRSMLMVQFVSNRNLIQNSGIVTYKKWGINVIALIGFLKLVGCWKIECKSYIHLLIYAIIMTLASFIVFGMVSVIYDRHFLEELLKQGRKS